MIFLLALVFGVYYFLVAKENLTSQFNNFMKSNGAGTRSKRVSPSSKSTSQTKESAAIEDAEYREVK
jgi:hypothetical protein